MKRILGLDISTSCTGWTVMDGNTLLEMGHIEFKNCNTLWEKADHGVAELLKVLKKYGPVDEIWVEESLQAFHGGASSAATIATLTKFNALLSYALRNHSTLEPKFISATAARSKCGMKIQKSKKCGKTGKEQAFEWVTTGPLKNWDYPKTKTNKPKPYCFDEVDSYVIALAGSLS